jgi:serine/threonine protein kinase
MAEKFPDPGEGYTIREYLGGGHWKSAYRASTPFRLADVALLFFHDNADYDTIVKDITSLIRSARGDPYSKHLAQFHAVVTGPGGKIFIVEELLARPLDRISPLGDITQFIRIARDLSRGLVFLHKLGLVHRDLKLDNCGLDQQQQAKIFDLGSVTSEPGDVLGTIFTRAPELFEKGAKCDNASDVWALGATLFALRTGDYPFVDKTDIELRRMTNLKCREGGITASEAQKRKKVIDAKVRERITRAGAEDELAEKIHRTLRGRAKDVLLSMLKFDRTERKDIVEIEAGWSSLARELVSSTRTSSVQSKWEQIKSQLRAVDDNETQLTRKQLDRIISEYHSDKPDDPELERHIKNVKEKLAMVE